MMGKTIADILIVFFFVFVNAFFSGTEMAVITLNDAKMRKMSEEGDRKARRIVRFLDNPGNFLATIQVGVTLAGIPVVAFAASNFAEKLAVLCDPDGKYPWMVTLWTVIITIVLSYFSRSGRACSKEDCSDISGEMVFRRNRYSQFLQRYS